MLNEEVLVAAEPLKSPGVKKSLRRRVMADLPLTVLDRLGHNLERAVGANEFKHGTAGAGDQKKVLDDALRVHQSFREEEHCRQA